MLLLTQSVGTSSASLLLSNMASAWPVVIPRDLFGTVGTSLIAMSDLAKHLALANSIGHKLARNLNAISPGNVNDGLNLDLAAIEFVTTQPDYCRLVLMP